MQNETLLVPGLGNRCYYCVCMCKYFFTSGELHLATLLQLGITTGLALANGVGVKGTCHFWGAALSC